MAAALHVHGGSTNLSNMRRRYGRRGFSIVEAMFAALVLGVGVMATVDVYRSGIQGRREARFRDLAHRLVGQRLESLDASGAERLPTCSGFPGCRGPDGEVRPRKAASGAYPCSQVIDLPSVEDRLSDDGEGHFRLDTTVAAHPDPEQRAEARLVTVSVCWYDLGGRLKEHTRRRLVLEAAEG